jgi:hypothetical protein
MNPDQQFGPPPNNYDFIMNPGKPPKTSKGISSVTNNKFFMMILLIVGGTVTLMIVVATMLNLFFGDKTNLTDIVAITQSEQEIIRVSTKGKQANDQVIKNAAMSTQLTLETHKKEWLAFLAKYGEEVDDKRLAAKKDLATDARLKNATLTSTFDSAFTLIMRSQVESYGASLQDAHSRATSKTQRAMLAKQYQQVELLLKQWPS